MREKIRDLVNRNILLSPENARELLREVDQAHAVLDEAGVPRESAKLGTLDLACRVAYLYLAGRAKGYEITRG